TSRVRSPRPLERTGVVGRGRVLSPRSLEEALEAMNRRPEATPIAGATDLYVHWPTHLEAHDRSYIDLTRIDALRGTRWTDDALVLGGLCTYWDVIRDPRIDAEFPLLREAGRQVGAVQIQTRGTWAGNIVNGSPAADGVPVLMAYDAVLTLVSAAGEEEVALDDFYLGYKDMRLRPGQLISAITIPRRGYSVQWFDKVGSRAAQAITKVGVAVTCSDEKEWRVVVNSVAPVVKRCPALERLLTGTRAPTLDQVRAATRADVSPIDDIRSTAEYRERVLARLVYFGLETHGPQDARA
ncbi:MAG: FAD binding domain-containing protein, partial [Gemmatimonadota bacterium]|nr:FAD binding domain-containing protein [Gemmatimonadota bacterium]